MKKWGSIYVFIIIWLYGCSGDPYPVYDEGEAICQVTEQPVLFGGSATMDPLITPDAKQIVITSAYAEFPNRARLVARELSTGKETVLAQFGYNADISPDGEWIAFNSSYGVISKIKLNGENFTTLPTEMTSSGNFSPAWHPNNIDLVYNHHSDLSNELSGSYVLRSDNSNIFIPGSGAYPEFFPDGNRVISVKGFDNKSIWKKFLIHNVETGKEIDKLDASVNENNQHPQVSPDGNQILYWNGVGFYVLQSDGSNVRLILPGRHFYENKKGDYLGFLVFSPSWHPDGKHIIYEQMAITEYTKCPDFCIYEEIIKGIVSIRKLRVN